MSVIPKERSMRSHLRAPHFAALGAITMLALAACSPPGNDPDAAPSGGATNTGTPIGAVSCGTEDVTLEAYVETGFPLFGELAKEFEKQFPNVKINIREDQFAVITQNAPRVLADDPPDLMRLPQMSELAKEGLLLNYGGTALFSDKDEKGDPVLDSVTGLPTKAIGRLVSRGVA